MAIADILSWLRLGPPPPVVAVLRLDGVIGATRPGARGLSMRELAGPIEGATSLRGAKALALVVNSPGGAPVQTALIAKRIRALAAEKKLPVYAFVEDVAASGGYWLASAADEIYADDSSIVGSIGVISAGFGLQGLIERIGVERRLHIKGEHKSLLDPFKPEKTEDVARLDRVLGDIHEAFKAAVRERRGAKLKASEGELFDGEIWTGRRALELGLIDGVGDIRGVMRAKFGDKVKFRNFTPGRSWLERRFGLASGAKREAIFDAIGALEERLLWARYGL